MESNQTQTARVRPADRSPSPDLATHLVNPISLSDHDLIRLRVIPQPNMLSTLSQSIQHPLTEILEINHMTADILCELFRRG